MSEFVTVARPYAKAAFDFAVEQQKIEHWQQMLEFSVQVSGNEQVANLLSGSLAPATLAKTFIDLCGEQLDESGRNLIRIMAENSRLPILAEVLDQFIDLKVEFHNAANVDVVSAIPLTSIQKEKIGAAVEKKLARKVTLNCKVDQSIISGVIIRWGDTVIDSSVRGRLDRLADVLQS